MRKTLANMLRMSPIGVIKNSTLKGRMYFSAVLMVLVAVVAWRFQANILMSLAVTASIVLLVEVFTFHKRKLVTALIILAQLGAVAALSYVTYASMLGSYIAGDVAMFVFSTLLVLMVLSTIIGVIVTFLLTRGKNWVTLLLAFLTYDIAYVFLVAGLQTQSVVLHAILAFAVMAIMLTVRVFVPRHKPEPFVPGDIRFSKGRVGRGIEKRLSNNVSDTGFKRLSNPDASLRSLTFLYYGRMYHVVMVNPLNSFGVKKNTLTIDEKSATGLFNVALSEAAVAGRKYGVKGRNITTVIYVEHNLEMPKLSTVKVSTRDYPDKVLGALHIASPDGFYALLKRNKNTNVGRLSGKKLSRLVAS